MYIQSVDMFQMMKCLKCGLCLPMGDIIDPCGTVQKMNKYCITPSAFLKIRVRNNDTTFCISTKLVCLFHSIH